MWKLIKRIFMLGAAGNAVLWYTGYKIQGKTIGEHLAPYLKTQAVKDLRSMLGEGLKAAGEAVSEDVTDEDKKALANVLKQELEKGKPVAALPGPNVPASAAGIVPQASTTQPIPEKQAAKQQTLSAAVKQMQEQAAKEKAGIPQQTAPQTQKP